MESKETTKNINLSDSRIIQMELLMFTLVHVHGKPLLMIIMYEDKGLFLKLQHFIHSSTNLDWM